MSINSHLIHFIKTQLLLIAFAFTFYLGHAQCATLATNFGNNTATNYDVSGDVTVTLNTNNTVSLDLGSNFTTAAGPDVRAYLINSNGLSDTQLQNSKIADLTYIEFGLVSCTDCTPTIPVNGEKSFTIPIPDGQDIRDYDKVFFYCFEFDAFWDFGSFSSFSNSNCNILSINESTLSKNINIYPNPTNKNIAISNSKEINANIQIYNVFGEKILHTQNNTLKEQTINLSSLKSGVYLVQIPSGGNRITKKLIKQ